MRKGQGKPPRTLVFFEKRLALVVPVLELGVLGPDGHLRVLAGARLLERLGGKVGLVGSDGLNVVVGGLGNKRRQDEVGGDCFGDD
jgi:hypothetical protein